MSFPSPAWIRSCPKPPKIRSSPALPWIVSAPPISCRVVSIRAMLYFTCLTALFLYLKDLKDVPRVQERLRRVLPAAGYQLMDPDPRAFWMKFQSVAREDWTGQKLDVTNWEDEISFMTWTLKALQGMSVVLIAIGLVHASPQCTGS
jgi:hypothetical protein